KHARIVILGLDNAGKTVSVSILSSTVQLLIARSHPEPFAHVHICPSRCYTARLIYDTAWEEFTIGRFRLSGYDLAHMSARRLWRDYVSEVDAIIYVVDSVDAARFPECKAELDDMLAFEAASKVPVLILGNKIDVPGAVSKEEFAGHLGLDQRTGKGGHPLDGIRAIEIFMCSVAPRQGYEEGPIIPVYIPFRC
ncbi:secretion-associated GTP-binding protein, partial [Mycena vulgaris]